MTKGLCYRCEFRAQFHELGHAPRMECGEATKAVHSCYQFNPVKPLILIKNAYDERPQFAGAMLSARSRSGGVPDLRLSVGQAKEGVTPYWVPKSSDELHLKAQKMLWFLEQHPALGAPIQKVQSFLDVFITQVCKNGYTELMRGKIDLKYTPQRYKQFKAEFDKEFKNYTEEELKTQKPIIYIDVPYEKVYGEKWAPDHIEYWGELSFSAFMGKDFKTELDYKKWQTLSGVEASGRSYQELVVNIGEKFKQIFGNFNSSKFLTPEERKNNKEQDLFLFLPFKGKKNMSQMKRNPEYIHVGPAELNRRWLVWFSKTPYCKKHWAPTVKSILSGKAFI